MSINTLYVTVTNSAGLVTGLTGGAGLPVAATWFAVHNPDASAKLTFTFDGTAPVVNGAGITLAAGLLPFNFGTDIACGGMKAISSAASQTMVILWK